MGLDMWAAGGWTDCFQLLPYCLPCYTTNTRDACSYEEARIGERGQGAL